MLSAEVYNLRNPVFGELALMMFHQVDKLGREIYLEREKEKYSLAYKYKSCRVNYVIIII